MKPIIKEVPVRDRIGYFNFTEGWKILTGHKHVLLLGLKMTKHLFLEIVC
jgi:hypothetical protein